MKKLIFILFAFLAISTTAQTVPSYPTVKLTKLTTGLDTDDVLTIGADKKVKKVSRASFAGNVNLDPLEFNVSNKTVWNNGKGNIDSNTFFGQNYTSGEETSGVGTHNTSYGSNVIPSGNGLRNTAIGSDINVHAWATSTTDGIFIGHNVRPSFMSINEIVIGNTVNGIDSNSVTIGNDLITKTRLRGQVYMGSIKLDAMNTAPASATDTGTVGEIRYTATHIYVCTATNTWVRTALTTF